MGGFMKGISANTTKKFFNSFGEVIEPIGMLVDFLPLRELTVDHQDIDPILCFSKFSLTA